MRSDNELLQAAIRSHAEDNSVLMIDLPAYAICAVMEDRAPTAEEAEQIIKRLDYEQTPDEELRDFDSRNEQAIKNINRRNLWRTMVLFQLDHFPEHDRKSVMQYRCAQLKQTIGMI